MFACVGLLGAALMAHSGWPRWRAVAILHGLGGCLFSGSLMALALMRLAPVSADGAATSPPLALVLATPAGGLCLLAGWVLMAVTALTAGSASTLPPQARSGPEAGA
jgi:uncharacterized membrane protein YgdD (TMEM256/DUF423 family)